MYVYFLGRWEITFSDTGNVIVKILKFDAIWNFESTHSLFRLLCCFGQRELPHPVWKHR